MKDFLIVLEIITSFVLCILGIAIWATVLSKPDLIQSKFIAKWLPFWILFASMCCWQNGLKAARVAACEANLESELSKK